MKSLNSVNIREATKADIKVLSEWDHEPHVISATTDDPEALKAFDDDLDWNEELGTHSNHSRFYIAEVEGKPIGALQIIDPHLEETHYWGEIEPNLRAIDIWIGVKEALGQGYGEIMMRKGLLICFSDPKVTAVMIDPLFSNKRAHKFYQRIGFVPVERRTFHEKDDCLVHKLTRSEWQKTFPLDQRNKMVS